AIWLRISAIRDWRSEASSSGRPAILSLYFFALFLLDEPDIAVDDRIAVILQADRAGRAFLAAAAGRLLGQFQIVVNLHAVVLQGDASVDGLFAVGVEFRGRIVEI